MMNSRIFAHAPRVIAVLMACGVWAGRSEAGRLYTVTDLTNNNAMEAHFYDGGYMSDLATLNNRGQVIGSWVGPQFAEYPFIYSSLDGGKVTLPTVTPPSGNNPKLYDNPGSYGVQGRFTVSNNQGELFGQYTGFEQNPSRFGSGFSDSNGQLIPTNSKATIVSANDNGQVLSRVPSHDPSLTGNFQESTITKDGVTRNIGIPKGSMDAEGVAINNAGMVVVNTETNKGGLGSNQSGPSQAHAFLLNGKTWTDLGSLGGPTTVANGMDSKGDVVGYSLDAKGFGHAVLIPLGKSIIDLGTLPGTNFSAASAINESGQIVGSSSMQTSKDNGYSIDVTASHGFIYQNGIMEDLNKMLLPGVKASITGAIAINDLGQILVNGNIRGGSGSGDLFLLSPEGVDAAPPIYPVMPVPEPSSCLLFGLTLISVASRMVRHVGRSRDGAPASRP